MRIRVAGALACLVLLAQPAAASSNLLTVVASSNPDKGRGAIFDPTHYANPQIDATVERSLATLDTQEREDLYCHAEGRRCRNCR